MDNAAIRQPRTGMNNLWTGPLDSFDCQTADLVRSSKKYPRLFTIFSQLRWNLQENGLLGTSRKVWSKVIGGAVAIGPRPVVQVVENSIADEVLGLRPGELVQIKSEEEVRRTLDASGKNLGLGFMPEMWPYCGRQGRVLRRVEKICLEEASRTVRAMKNTVILEGLFCQGNSIGCDRACFYFWRECWLKRVPSSSMGPGQRAEIDLVAIKPGPQC
jgi:hypothetical protein